MHTLNWDSTRTPATLLVTGASLAALILMLGMANAHRMHARLEQLELACIAEVLSREDAADAQTPNCDPTTLIWTESPRDPYRGIQGEIIATQATLWQLDSLLMPVVCAILALTATPWMLRFVSTQVGRFRQAGVGK
jgi:hypothetical protein